MMTMFVAAVVMGMVGSLHCIGMCGPIALALPLGRGGKGSLWLGRSTYNLGRIMTYASMGMIVGIMGEAVNLAGYQQGLSITLGIAILLSVVLQWGHKYSLGQWANRGMLRLKKQMGRLLGDGHPKALFQLGLLNGFLPCGLVYMAMAGAAATGDVWQSSLFMVGFGLGTFPLMLGISLLGPLMPPKTRNALQPLILVFSFAFAILLILRGLGLGIPMISPEIHTDLQSVSSCS